MTAGGNHRTIGGHRPPLQEKPESELPLRELEAFPGTGLAGFLALLHPRIAAEKSFRLERSTKIRVDQEQRPRDRQPGCSRLTSSPTTGRINGNVVRVRELHDLQRLEDRVLERDRRKIILKTLAVDVDLAVAGRHANARDGSFAAAGSDEFLSFSHGKNLK